MFPLGCFVLFAFLSLENAFVFRPDFTYSKLLGIIVFSSYLLHIFGQKFSFAAPQKLILVLCFWSWAGLLWCLNPELTKSTLMTWTLYVGICFIAISIIHDKQSFKVVLSGFVLGAAVAALLLLLGHVEYDTWSAEELGRGGLSEENSPVILGRALAFGFIVACLVFFERNKWLKRITFALLVLIYLAIVAKSQSRMATIVCVAAPVFAFILTSKGGKRTRNFFIALVISCFAFFAMVLIIKSDLISERGAERFKGQGLVESGRTKMWADGLHIIMKRPLHGYGLNNSPLAREGRAQGGSLHNSYVAMTADLGLIGLSLMIALGVVLYKQIKAGSDPQLKFIGMAMLVFAGMTGLTSVNYTKKDVWYALMVAMVAIAIDRLNTSNNDFQADDQKSLPLK